MTSYFITGGLGFLGQHVASAIHAHDPQGEVRVLMRRRRTSALGTERLERVRLVAGELGRPESYAGELGGVETVVHCAALVSFKTAEAGAMYLSNAVGTRELIEAAIAQGCKNFIYISSISTLVWREGQPIDEALLPDLEELRQRDPYGYSKRVGEIEVERRAGQIRGVMLNPSVIIGPGDRRIEGGLRAWRWLRWLAPAVPMISMINSFVDVRDAARAAVLALSYGESGERYIVTSHNVDMVSFTRAALRAVGWRRRVFVLTPGIIRAADGVLSGLDRLHLNPGMRPLRALNVDKAYSTEKIRRKMGWEPVYSLEETLRDTFG